MANHFQAIGFAANDRAQVNELLLRAAQQGEAVRTPAGEYVRWAPGGGAELWAQVVGGAVVGLALHFAGSTSLPVAVVERVVQPDRSPLDGCLQVWVNPPAEGDLDTGEYPFVLAAPDYRALDGLHLPALARVQVTAFAHDLEVYASEQAYLDGQASELKFAAESLIPSGMFVDEGAPPAPLAMISGRVLAAERRMNPAGGPFWWMQVRTLGGEIDVVAETAVVDAEPVPGGVVSGSFYLSGRVTPDAPAPGTG